ncbi:MAG: signal peptidase II [Bdellovibrionota bacterium]|jgi:signal peptidase II
MESGTEQVSITIGQRLRAVSHILIPVVLFVVVSDQYTKHLVVQRFQPLELLPIIDGLFNLTLHYNKGAAFGLFHDLPDGIRQLTLWGVSGIAMVAVVYFLLFEFYQQRIGVVSMSLILGGAIGNGIDRALLGKVVDFLDFYIGTYHWPAFNVADIAISVGAGLLVIITIQEQLRVKT